MALGFRDGDIVEVRPNSPGITAFQPFQGVVDSRASGEKGFAASKWVFVRKFGHTYSGGWYPSQCRRIARPTTNKALSVPNNIILGEN